MAWRLLLKELDQQKQLLGKMQLVAIELQRQFFDGRSALMDHEYDGRRRLQRMFAKGSTAYSARNLWMSELNRRSQLYEYATGRDEIVKGCKQRNVK